MGIALINLPFTTTTHQIMRKFTNREKTKQATRTTKGIDSQFPSCDQRDKKKNIKFYMLCKDKFNSRHSGNLTY